MTSPATFGGQEELVFSFSIKYFGHARRMVCQILDAVPTERRPFGRPNIVD